MSKTNPILKVSGLHFSYGNKAILKGLNFSVKEGETLGIIGESGSGKTSLLKLLGGLLRPDKGQLLFDGEPVAGPDERLIAGHEKIKLVNQDFDLMPYLSVKENMLRNSLSESERGRRKLLTHFQKRLKLKGISDNRATDTSGGQKQRTAWATALSTQPDVLLLDEPFSNLDYPLKTELIQLLKTEWKPRAMIVVTHEPGDILHMADRLLVMHKGRIVQRGTTQEVYQNPKNELAGRLLGPLNVLSAKEAAVFGVESKKEIYLRPHQFEIGEKGVSGAVNSCRFVGTHHLVEVLLKEGLDKTILVRASTKVTERCKVSLAT